MRLLRLNIRNYGKFSNQKIELKDGINIIYGDNEAGKSTIHSFIRGMLFGLERQRGRASKEDHYIKYQPWDQGGIYGGTLDLRYQDRNYRIYRDFSKENRTYQVVDLSTGREQPVENRKGISFIEELTEDNYSNTISIEQLKAKTNKDLADEVKNHLANLTTSKSNQISVGDALIQLKAKKKQLENGDTNRKISETMKNIGERENEERRMLTLSNQIKGLKEDLKKEEALLVNEDILKLEDYIEEYPRIREKYNQYERLIREKEELENTFHEISINKMPIDKIPIDKMPTVNNRKSYVIPFIIGILLLAIALMVKQPILLAIGIGIIGLTAVYYVINRLTSKGKQESYNTPAAQAGEEDKRQSLKCLYQLIQEEKKTIIQYASRLIPLQQLDESYMSKLATEILLLKENLRSKREEAREGIDKIRIEIERLNWELDRLEEAEDKNLELKETLKELKELEVNEKKEIQAITLAIDTIQSISIEIHDSLGQSLNEILSDTVCKLTKGRYSSVLVDENLNIKVAYKEEFIPLEGLSVGTVEQIYLALRLAVTQILYPKEKLPILLDDTFAYYDKERLSAALELFDKEDRQIIIFTCHSREEEILEQLGISFHQVKLN